MITIINHTSHATIVWHLVKYQKALHVVKHEWASSVNSTFPHLHSGWNSRMRATFLKMFNHSILSIHPLNHLSSHSSIQPWNSLACLVSLTRHDKTHNSNILAYVFTVLSWHISYHSNMGQQVRRDPSESLLHGLELSSLVLLFILPHTLPQH